MSQCERLLQRLKEGPVTPMEAWNELGIYRVGARVFDLRKRGHDIVTKKHEVLNCFGEVCEVALYQLVAANDGSAQ